ncbi:TonB-dependent receptor-like protein [Rhodothalassium salexigens DSM 2132]|uniref:TonB-dependent receptor-like protein n=1 Tax=Rhodothalassium salexigens DSM 2132 TaxID=1188247 RepID=A0A4R2PF31_RHOSA|nr:TonB-dependent receptor [Rhodothalassium salexigens]MBB4211813.1 outer membrane receptor protein involved in Fe transport [Rhodothalassium salexigens DSM 2132]MBK1638148.1 hypothetical protein [Rhodothalassium salexigens DSM 2132]TCP33889.1 TonB-dependent receptor-like protein [Rhodothalassium salexigens DSM 2132]
MTGWKRAPSVRNALLGSTALSFVLFGAAGAAVGADRDGPLAELPEQQAQQRQAAPPVATRDADELVEPTVEEIVVTGSRLRTTNFETSVPLTIVTSEQLEFRGFTNVVDAVNEIPLIGGANTSAGGNTQFGDNFSFQDILDLGTNRTLTLINGRRVISNNQGSVFVPGNATGAQVDVTTINPFLVERQEIVAGTGGAIYGADALAGVINYVLKDDFDGLSATAQGGITQEGDGANYRANLAWGKNFLEDRANLSVAGEFFRQELVRGGGPRDILAADISGIINPADGARRAPAAGAGDLLAQLRQGDLTSAFVPAGSDGRRSTIFIRDTTNPYLPIGGGAIGTTFQASGNASLLEFFPRQPVSGGLAAPGADPAGFAFFAPSSLPAGVDPLAVINQFAPGADLSGLSSADQAQLALNLLQRNRPTPGEYFLGNPGLDPNLFVGTFANGGGAIPTIANPDPATQGLFPRLAVPLRFDNGGRLVPNDLGRITPPGQAVLNETSGGDGFDFTSFENLESAVERRTFNLLGRYDLTDNITYKQTFFFADLAFDSLGSPLANSFTGSVAGGSLPIPVYVDDNPYLTNQARTELGRLRSLGLQLPNEPNDGGEVVYLSRVHDDLFPNGPRSGERVRNYRTANELLGEFERFGREFYWDAAFVYGRNTTISYQETLSDINFALATDPVDDGTGNIVCRQQTLAQPESIANRNFLLGFINIDADGDGSLGEPEDLVPSQAAVDGCLPFNVTAKGPVSQELRDYLVIDSGAENRNEQFYGAASIGTDIVQLPGGPFAGLIQAEWRRESTDFDPKDPFARGLGRNTVGQGTQGTLSFFEGGFEGKLPIFGEDFTLPGFERLILEGGVRVVNRSQSTQNPLFSGIDAGSVTDITYTAGGRWVPFEGLVFRGARSRTVRSPSAVELFGAPQTGFGGRVNPCDVTNINQGPAPATRRANCIAAVQAVGLAANDAEAAAFLSGYQGAGGSAPGGTAGNPNLQNEFSDAWSVGGTFAPDFVPGLTLSLDYYAVDLKGEIGLVGPGVNVNACFDQPNFPNNEISGTNVCDQFLFGVQDETGAFVIPEVNPLTGNPVSETLVTAVPGQRASLQDPFQLAFVNFPQLNLAATQLRAINAQVTYTFEPADLLPWDRDLGAITLRGYNYFLQRYDQSSLGDFTDTNPQAGDVFSRFESRIDFIWRYQDFQMQLQWFRNQGTVDNVQTEEEDLPEQSPIFFNPTTQFFNLNMAYVINENLNARFIINNLNNSRGPQPQFDVLQSPLGRSFIFALDFRF